jgi:hypothetical protein
MIQTKKVVLRLECTACKVKHQLTLKRCKHFELGGDKKQVRLYFGLAFKRCKAAFAEGSSTERCVVKDDDCVQDDDCLRKKWLLTITRGELPSLSKPDPRLHSIDIGNRTRKGNRQHREGACGSFVFLPTDGRCNSCAPHVYS